MKFGYFYNTTNWDHKPYNQLSDETSMEPCKNPLMDGCWYYGKHKAKLEVKLFFILLHISYLIKNFNNFFGAFSAYVMFVIIFL